MPEKINSVDEVRKYWEAYSTTKIVMGFSASKGIQEYVLNSTDKIGECMKITVKS